MKGTNKKAITTETYLVVNQKHTIPSILNAARRVYGQSVKTWQQNLKAYNNNKKLENKILPWKVYDNASWPNVWNKTKNVHINISYIKKNPFNCNSNWILFSFSFFFTFSFICFQKNVKLLFFSISTSHAAVQNQIGTKNKVIDFFLKFFISNNIKLGQLLNELILLGGV